MMTRHFVRLIGISAFALAIPQLTVAKAEPLKVGQAEVIRNEVVNVDGAKLLPIAVGDTVVRDEVVSTSKDSDARIGLIDSTKLALGPNSTLKIDRAVYADESRYKQIVIRLTEGAFRFVTGNSDKKSYRIETPTAVVGVRGTILDILISENKTLVTLQDGLASVCAGKKCTRLLERGHTATVTLENGITQIKRDLVPTWTFASICSDNSSLCAPLPPLANLTKRAALPAATTAAKAAKGALTRLCPNGQPMVGGSCATDLTNNNGSLPGINDVARDASVPPLGPATQDLGVGSTLGRVGVPSPGGLSLPRLGR
jgi:hypothetical protein